MAKDKKFRFTYTASDGCGFSLINSTIIEENNFFKAVDDFKDYLSENYFGCFIGNIEAKEIDDETD